MPSISSILYRLVDNVHLEGTVSQIFDLGLSSNFMLNNGKNFVIFPHLIFYI